MGVEEKGRNTIYSLSSEKGPKIHPLGGKKKRPKE